MIEFPSYQTLALNETVSTQSPKFFRGYPSINTCLQVHTAHPASTPRVSSLVSQPSPSGAPGPPHQSPRISAFLPGPCSLPVTQRLPTKWMNEGASVDVSCLPFGTLSPSRALPLPLFCSTSYPPFFCGSLPLLRCRSLVWSIFHMKIPH